MSILVVGITPHLIVTDHDVRVSLAIVWGGATVAGRQNPSGKRLSCATAPAGQVSPRHELDAHSAMVSV